MEEKREKGSLRAASLAGRIRRAMRQLDRETAACAALAERLRTLPTEAEWLLDNRYLAERAAKGAAMELRRGGRLRQSENGRSRPEAAAAELLCGQEPMGMDCLRTRLEALQAREGLEEKELALLIPALILLVTEALAALARRVRLSLERREEDAGQTEAGTAEEAERLFGLLRFLETHDMGPLLESVSRVEAAFSQDPAGVYLQMDRESRALYRHTLSRLAKRAGLSEEAAARRVLELAEKEGLHVGEFLFVKPLSKPCRRRPGGYTAGLLSAAVLAALGLAFLSRSVWAALAALLPLYETVRSLSDWLLLKCVKPRRLPRLALEGGIPAGADTLCALTVLLTTPDSVSRALRALEEFRLANRDAGDRLRFALLADLREAESETCPEDEALIRAAREGIEALDRRYGGFTLFLRPRRRAPRDGCWRGWERKRGAILELSAWLHGEEGGLKPLCGDETARGSRYLIVLDADTRLTVGTARELVAVMEHPLCRPVVDRARRRVCRGHGVLQPRVALDLRAAERSDFARLYGGQGGVDPYASVCCDLYQDLFDRGSFSGKGILDVEAVCACLEGRFPEERVLSHDLLEGEILRSGFVGDVELTDGFPARFAAYFDRLHRWVRGDWQTLPWLFHRVPTAQGREKNPLDLLSRWKIFDNLCRSLAAPAALLCLCLAVFCGGFGYAAAAAVLSLGAELLTAFAERICRPGELLRRHYASRRAAGASAVLLRFFLRLLFLPYESYVALSACFTALYRMLISRRRLLQWVTAEEADRSAGGGVAAAFKRQWFSLLAGACFLLYACRPLPAALGLLWLLSPAVSCALSREKAVSRHLGRADRAFLLGQAAAVWRYFRENMKAELGFLPPDNVQEEPQTKRAERGSPTNFGLALLAPVAALDLGLCEKGEALAILRGALERIEALPRWKGLLYNWYDLREATVLRPAYVSSVDCGNFAACLAALETALRELGETDLAERADRLLRSADLRPLYDAERKLFRIGFNAEEGRLSEGCYDLMVSEARLTSYLALAMGWADKRHWRSLSRVLRRAAGRSGMASWSGSVFEYFMPGLLLEEYEGSLMGDSLRLCLAAQRRRGKPWGVSESAYAAFDEAMNYRYKAHGVQALALKRGMDEERVISPYSSFLATAVSPRAAVRNLRRLEAMGMAGRYGLYEALDLTPGRCERQPEPVRCYMTHHLGMSLLALDNLLAEGVMRRRLMCRPEFAAFRELLQEKGPVGQRIRREKPVGIGGGAQRLPAERWRRLLKGTDWMRPACCLLSNGLYTVLCSELGTTRSVFKGKELTVFRALRDGAPEGVSFYFFSDERLLPLQPSPDDAPGIRRYCEMEADRFRLFTAAEGLECCVETAVARSAAGERRSLRFTNLMGRPVSGVLLCAFEPVLAVRQDYEAHPAYSKLSLESCLLEGCVLFKRRKALEAEPGLSLAFAASEPYSFDTFRQETFGRGGLRAVRTAAERPAGGTAGAMVEPCLLARVALSIPAGGERRVCFSLATAESAAEAAREAQAILNKSFRRAGSLESAAGRLKMDLREITESLDLLSASVFGWGRSPEALSASVGRAGLWRFGVSGDRPVIAARCERGEAGRFAFLLRAHALLRCCGCECDLLLLTADGGEYLRPDETGLRTAAAAVDRAAGPSAPGSVTIAAAEEEEAAAALAAADAALPLPSAVKEEPPTEPWVYPAPVRKRASYPFHFEPDGSFVFDTEGGLADTAWTLPLTNGRFGCLAADCSAAFLWDGNARERRLTPWVNDPLADRGGEELWLVYEGERLSLFAACDGWDCRVRFGFGFAEWEKTREEKQLRTTVFVPRDTNARVLLVEQRGFSAPLRLCQRLRPVLGDRPGAARRVRMSEEGGGLRFDSTEKASFSAAFSQFGSSRPYAGRWLPWEEQCRESFYPLESGFCLVSGTDDPVKLRALTNLQAAREALRETRRAWQSLTGSLRVRTPSPRLDRWLNGWALYQTVACRLLARTSLYQSGGAYGFRDQLQDAACAAPFVPALCRRQLLSAAAHQYREGDVMHWWHEGEEGDRGIRTRCSDDLLWLPWAAARYVAVSGDDAVWEERRPWLLSAPLREQETDRYEQAVRTEETATLRTHCEQALRCFLSRPRGSGGLPDMGSGDWNDGFDRVRRESVWLAWFAALTLRAFSPFSPEHEADWLQAAEELSAAAEAAWDGGWYRRGTMADGSPLGSSQSAECRIDSVAQSFAVLSGGGSPAKARQAVLAAYEQLFDPASRTVKLFDPPFDRGPQEPGYIRRYLPGVRENGGQYTHAAVWLGLALLKCGETEKGWAVLEALLPGEREQRVYKTEPFVLAADVYTAQGHPGRGGWSWYTGAAGWLLLALTEGLLGLKVRGGELHIAPRLPEGWAGYEAEVNGESVAVSEQGKRVERAAEKGANS